MGEGRAQNFGPKDEVLTRVLRPAPAPAEPEARPAAALKVVQA
jgi:ATP-binding cassette subfamily C protein